YSPPGRAVRVSRVRPGKAARASLVPPGRPAPGRAAPAIHPRAARNPRPAPGVDVVMSVTASFAVTWDYRCPFARNAHEHLLAGLADGAGWEVDFQPFSLSQVHVEEGQPDVWDNPSKAPDLLALEVGVVVRDRMPDRFPEVHRALFSARHDEDRDIRVQAVVSQVLTGAGVDAGAVLAEVADGWPRESVRKSHEAAVADNQVFGVPTFVTGGQAAFVRIMTRPGEDGALARRTIDRILDLVTGVPELNELKHTTISR
ncbi:MAG: DsbA family protein, partial [Acidimicrobiales bacterium]